MGRGVLPGEDRRVKKKSRVYVILASTVALVLSLRVVLSTPLRVFPSSGVAPLRVRVVEPSDLVELSAETYVKGIGCGFTIDWGDSAHPTAFDPSCARSQVHDYVSRGSYRIVARRFHPNSEESHTVDWSGETSVVVR